MLLKHTLTLQNTRLLCLPARSLAHYTISPTGEKVVVTTRHVVKMKREKWQNVQPMGHEEELLQIKRIERDDRLESDANVARTTAQSKLTQLRDRLLLAGYCRDVKSYDPPSDVDAKIDAISREVFGPSVVSNQVDSLSLDQLSNKFKFLVRCSQEFNYSLPNCQLFEMKTVGDVRHFYSTPIQGINTYNRMTKNSKNLPQNLHLIEEPIRFNPETDKLFNGVSAFPGMTHDLKGLRAKKKYPTFKDNFVWPDV